MFAIVISAHFSMHAYFQAIPSQIQHEMQRMSLSLVPPHQIHTEALSTGSSWHLWFTCVSSPSRMKQPLLSNGCSCFAHPWRWLVGSSGSSSRPEDSLACSLSWYHIYSYKFSCFLSDFHLSFLTQVKEHPFSLPTMKKKILVCLPLEANTSLSDVQEPQ